MYETHGIIIENKKKLCPCASKNFTIQYIEKKKTMKIPIQAHLLECDKIQVEDNVLWQVLPYLLPLDPYTLPQHIIRIINRCNK